MPDIKQYSFNYKEVVEALIKFQDLHEGIWQFNPEISMQAQNLGPDANNLRPTIMLSFNKVAISRTDLETNLSVDAAKVNPMKKE